MCTDAFDSVDFNNVSILVNIDLVNTSLMYNDHNARKAHCMYMIYFSSIQYRIWLFDS